MSHASFIARDRAIVNRAIGALACRRGGARRADGSPVERDDHAHVGVGDAAAAGGRCVELGIVISQGLPIYVALEPVDTRMGYERLGELVRERMRSEPRSKALFVFLGKRGHTMKVLTWDGTGAIIVHKNLDAGKFELPKSTHDGDQHVIVSDAIFEVIYKGVSTAPNPRPHARALSGRCWWRLRCSIALVQRRDVSSAAPPESKAKRSADDRATLVSTLQSEMLGIKTRLTESETRNESLQETIVNLAHENELLKRRIYGNKTEKLRTSENQLALRVERYTSAPACLTDQQHPPPPQQLLQSSCFWAAHKSRKATPVSGNRLSSLAAPAPERDERRSPVACSLRYRAAVRAPTTPKPVARRRARTCSASPARELARGRLRGQVGVVVTGPLHRDRFKQEPHGQDFVSRLARPFRADLQRLAGGRAGERAHAPRRRGVIRRRTVGRRHGACA
jgi:transposase